jgi:integrase
MTKLALIINSEPRRRTNYNVGETQEVFPLKSKEEIQGIAAYFKENHLYNEFLFFSLGINIGLRAGDLLKLKYCDLFYDDGALRYNQDALDTTDGVCVYEQKTSKKKIFFLNRACRDALAWYVETTGVSVAGSYGCYLFPGYNGRYATVDWMRKRLKQAANAVGIRQNVGTHTLRKTFGYWQYKERNGDPDALVMLQRMFNHSSAATTLRYIGITAQDEKLMYGGCCLFTLQESACC